MKPAHHPWTSLPRRIVHVLRIVIGNTSHPCSILTKTNKTQRWLPYKFHFVPSHCDLSPDSWCFSAKDQRTVVGYWLCQDHRCGSRSNKAWQTGKCLSVAVTDALSCLISFSSKASGEETTEGHNKRLIHKSTVGRLRTPHLCNLLFYIPCRKDPCMTPVSDKECK